MSPWVLEFRCDPSNKPLLEFRHDSDNTLRAGLWFTFTRGSLEECLVDLLAFKGGSYPMYDMARLVWDRS